ncbi:hypothetical protein WR25_17349 isoform J [Diploscapter pachys]|uniref:F-box domain-containing protein n=1 Tax=Diploscapter pachys TaxID=2018661 RepID=A0A2A2JN16_9BILA|nr:hypothetical protein WR25_17349 isoform J [Diploscapter pachys]
MSKAGAFRKLATKAKKGFKKLTKIMTPRKNGPYYVKAGFLFTNPDVECEEETTELLVRKKEQETKFGLDFLIIRSDSRGNYELQSDRIQLIISQLLHDCPGYKDLGDAISFGHSNAQQIVRTIGIIYDFYYASFEITVSQVTGITHLWVDTAHNASILQAIIDIFSIPFPTKSKQRLNLEQLTAVGCVKHNDIDALCSFLLLCRRTLSSVRLRHCRLHSNEQSVRFWTAIGQCSRIAQLQYEPCRQDQWSLPHLVLALDKKPLRSIILTGIQGLDSNNLWKICKSPDLTELAVVGDCISPETYTKPDAIPVLNKLRNLLVQVYITFQIKNLLELSLQIEESYCLEDSVSRDVLVKILNQLDESSVFEVIHMVRGGSYETSRIIAYWAQLANDCSRHIQLKLEGCAQECQDSAVGRLLRRSSTATKVRT